MPQDKPLTPLLLTAIGAILIAAGLTLLPETAGAALVREAGIIETLTVYCYLAAAMLLIGLSLYGKQRYRLSAVIIVLLLGLRELDFHDRFTTMGILKSSYYLSPDVPWPEKTTVSLLMISIVFFLLHFIRHNAISFFNGLRQRRRPELAVALSLGYAVSSKILDSFSRPIRSLLEPLCGTSRAYLRIYEEVLELAIPLFILWAIYYSVRDNNKKVLTK